MDVAGGACRKTISELPARLVVGIAEEERLGSDDEVDELIVDPSSLTLICEPPDRPTPVWWMIFEWAKAQRPPRLERPSLNGWS